MDGAARQIGVARCGLEVAVTEQLTDHLQQGLAARQRAGREGVPEIVNSHVLQPGVCADAAPGLLQIGDVGAR